MSDESMDADVGGFVDSPTGGGAGREVLSLLSLSPVLPDDGREVFSRASARDSGDLPSFIKATEVQAVLSRLLALSTSVQESAFQRARALRVRALVRFLWLTGARISEALAVTVGDIDGHACVVRLSTLKRRKAMQRAVPLPAEYVQELGCVVRAGGQLDAGSLVFPWSRAQASRLVHDALVAVGIEADRAHPHALRHGHAVHAVENHVPLPVIQRVLGHSSVNTTSVYLEVTGQDVRRYYDSMTW